MKNLLKLYLDALKKAGQIQKRHRKFFKISEKNLSSRTFTKYKNASTLPISANIKVLNAIEKSIDQMQQDLKVLKDFKKNLKNEF